MVFVHLELLTVGLIPVYFNVILAVTVRSTGSISNNNTVPCSSAKSGNASIQQRQEAQAVRWSVRCKAGSESMWVCLQPSDRDCGPTDMSPCSQISAHCRHIKTKKIRPNFLFTCQNFLFTFNHSFIWLCYYSVWIYVCCLMWRCSFSVIHKVTSCLLNAHKLTPHSESMVADFLV